MKQKMSQKINKDIYDCNICRYVFYNPNDKEEHQRCMVITMTEKPPVNKELLSYILNSNEKISFCEYFERRQRGKK